MNCAKLLDRMGYDCSPLGDAGWCVHTPFLYSGDGEMIRLFVRDLPGGRVRIYDGGDAVMHAEVHGSKISRPRMEKIRRMLRAPVTLDEREEIGATCAVQDIPLIMPMVIDATLAVSHLETLWRPRKDRNQFIGEIEGALRPLAGEKLKRNVRVTGMSGHQIEFPLAISNAGQDRYIDAVSWNGEQLDWGSAYRVFGKMMDVDWTGMEERSHMVIVEDVEDNSQSQQVITFLARCAPVFKFSKLNSWIEAIVA